MHTCHRTLTPDPHPRYLYDRSKVSEEEMEELMTGAPLVPVSGTVSIVRLSSASPCLGSACAMCVRQGGLGYGVCADNLRAVPWGDPALPKNKEPR